MKALNQQCYLTLYLMLQLSVVLIKETNSSCLVAYVHN